MNDKKLLIDCIDFNFSKDLLFEEAIKNDGKRLVVKGILQRANVKNQNGRVYKKDILVREGKKYEENFIKERRALGELDHPECVSDCDIMTYNGWKNIKNVQIGDSIPTLNTTTNTIEYNPIERIINEPYKGKMISIKGKNIDVLVTPNHRFILNNRKGEFIEKTANEIFDISKTTKSSHLSIPIVSENWNGIKYDTFVIPSANINSKNKNDYKEKCDKDLILNASDWFSFLGFYLAEGHTSNRIDGKHNYGVFITQKQGEISEEFKKILNRLSDELVWKEHIRHDNVITFVVYDARLWSYLNKLGNKYNKFIPNEVKNASTELLQNLYDWFLNGDGTITTYDGYDRSSIFSVSKQLIEDFYEVILKLGMTGVIKEQITKKDYMFAGHLIESKNKSTLYRLYIKESKSIHLDFRFIKIKEIEYDGNVHCVTVKNGTFYCRNENKSFWSGNSSVVNLKNVSHNIIEMHFEGDDLIGTIEILPTPNGNILKELFRSNIRLGISSRGMGTVNKSMNEDADVVQDDFELIAFDFVSNPSTRGAFMFPSGNLQEGVNKNIVQNPITNQWESIENIVRDILTEIG